MVCQHGNTLTLAALMPGSARTGAESEPHQFPSIRLTPLVTAGLERPLFLTHAGDRSGCLFVMEQSGTIRIIDQGVLRKVPFLDVRDRVATDGPERGLLGLAFHPDHRLNGRIFAFRQSDEGERGAAPTVLLKARFRIVSFGQDEEGELYVADHGGGMYRLVSR
jgi:glucose/arabinose dehydrogenase